MKSLNISKPLPQLSQEILKLGNPWQSEPRLCILLFVQGTVPVSSGGCKHEAGEKPLSSNHSRASEAVPLCSAESAGGEELSQGVEPKWPPTQPS